MKRRLAKSVRIYIRREKARIRMQFSDPKEAEGKIAELTLRLRK